MHKKALAIPALSLVMPLLGLLLWLELQCPTVASALASGDYFLRQIGSDVLSTTSPTAATAQFKDSPAVTRTAYQAIGEWAATPADSSLRLSATTALHVWLGLKNSDDQGTYFDLRAELRKNGVVIASGETKNIQGVTRNANQAKEVTLTFGSPVNAQFMPVDVLSVRILAKVADSGGHNNAVGVRLYYDAPTRLARFGTTFAPVNTAPVANAGADQTGVVGQTLQLDGSGSSDLNGDPLTYQWTLTAKPNGSGAALLNPTTVQPSLTLDKPGNYTGQLIVNNGTANSAPDTVVISTVNSAPVAHAGPDQTGIVAQTIQLNGSGSSDVDGDLLTYQWTLTGRPAGSSATVTNSTSVTPTVTLDKPGNYTGRLVVNDGTVNSAPDTVVISTVNSAPIAQAGPDQTHFVGDTAQLDGSGSSDVDGDPLSYQWLVTARPMGSAAILDNPTTVAPSFLVDKPGTYTVQLIVNDGTADSTPDTITISTLNTRPTAEAGPDQEVHVGEIVQLDGSGSTDAEGDPLLYVWSLATVPAGSAATLTGANTRQATFVPDVAGTYVAQLIVNDGMLDSEPDTATVTVTVLDTTPPPPADLSHITVGPVLNDHITVSGAAGSVEDGAQVTLTNIRTGQSVTVTANADGRNHSGEVTADTVYGLSLQNPDAGWSWLGSFTGYSNGSTLHLPFETAYPTHYFFNASGTQAVSVKDTVSGDHANPFQKIVLDVNVAVGHADFSLGHVESIDLDGTTITSGGYTYSLVNTKEVVGEQVVAHSAEVHATGESRGIAFIDLRFDPPIVAYGEGQTDLSGPGYFLPGKSKEKFSWLIRGTEYNIIGWQEIPEDGSGAFFLPGGTYLGYWGSGMQDFSYPPLEEIGTFAVGGPPTNLHVIAAHKQPNFEYNFMHPAGHLSDFGGGPVGY